MVAWQSLAKLTHHGCIALLMAAHGKHLVDSDILISAHHKKNCLSYWCL
jgi:hypothetical protein